MVTAESQGPAISQQVCTAFLSERDRRDLESDGVKGPTPNLILTHFYEHLQAHYPNPSSSIPLMSYLSHPLHSLHGWDVCHIL